MARIFVSIGSNIDRENHIRAGIAALRAHFGALSLSPVYESESVGFAGDNFFNLVAGFESNENLTSVCRILTEIEDANGRDRSGPRFSSRTLDIDLLLYDDLVIHDGKLQLPRPEIYKNAFVLKPLADIAPDIQDPIHKTSYSRLWKMFDDQSQALWPVAFDMEAVVN